ISGTDQLPVKSNYFVGSDPKKWRTGVPNYAGVRYANVYPGIDLIYHGSDQQRLEYDFVVAPGADPRRIEFGFKGARTLSLNAEGDLVVHTELGEVIEHAPMIYQQT